MLILLSCGSCSGSFAESSNTVRVSRLVYSNTPDYVASLGLCKGWGILRNVQREKPLRCLSEQTDWLQAMFNGVRIQPDAVAKQMQAKFHEWYAAEVVRCELTPDRLFKFVKGWMSRALALRKSNIAAFSLMNP